MEETRKEDLKAANKRFEEVLNSLDSLVYAIDMKTYEVLFINKYGRDNWGEIEGKICWQTLQKGKSGPCEFCTNKRLIGQDGKPSGTVVWEIQNTGNKRWYECRDRAIYWPDGRLVRIEIATDITEKKKAHKELIHSHDLMRYIIEHNRSAVAVHDGNLKYIYVSQRYLDEYKVKEKDVIGKHHYDVFPDLPQKWRDVHQKVLAGETLSAEDDPYVREDGTVDWTRWECRPWYEADGSIGGIIVYTEVITERKRADEELKKHRDHLEEIVKERTAELNKKNEEFEKINKVFVGRELRMIELKKIIDEKDKRISDLENEKVDLEKQRPLYL